MLFLSNLLKILLNIYGNLSNISIGSIRMPFAILSPITLEDFNDVTRLTTPELIKQNLEEPDARRGLEIAWI